MLSMTHAREAAAHLAAIVDVIRPAIPPGWAVDEAALEAVPVCALPALKLLQVSRGGLRRFRNTWATGRFQGATTYVNPRGEAFLVLPLGELLGALHFSAHPVGRAYAVWDSEVEAALTRHGWYDPATHHTPPVGMELEAMEMQSAMREAYRAFWGRSWEATWGREPSTQQEEATHACE
jgi:hypothetical protein